MKFNMDNPWIIRLIALLLSVVLFSFVSLENQSRIRSTNPTDGASITSSEVVTNLPIDINIDRDNYFVSGIPETATIRLEGPQAVLTQTLATQSYNIVTPDLNALGPGRHTIPLEAEGLSSQLSYSIMPAEVTVDIEQKIVEEHDVRVEFNESAHLEDGYTAGEPLLSNDVVTISGAASTMDMISDVMVIVMPEGSDIVSDIEMTLNVLVVDEAGEPLNVNISPQQIDVLIPVEGTQRTLPIVLEQVGTPREGYEYTLELAQGEPENVIITGESDAIEAFTNFSVQVDISGITESTIRTVPIVLPDGVSESDPEEIDVLIRVRQLSNGEEDLLDPGDGNVNDNDEEEDEVVSNTSDLNYETRDS